MSAGDCSCAARAMLLIVAPLKPFSENSSNAASKICPRRSDSSAKGLLLDRTFNTRRIFSIEHLVKCLETSGWVCDWTALAGRSSWKYSRYGRGKIRVPPGLTHALATLRRARGWQRGPYWRGRGARSGEGPHGGGFTRLVALPLRVTVMGGETSGRFGRVSHV